MLKLVTGSPGDGKTSNELWDFLKNPKYNGRPKYCTPVNGFEPHLHGVIPIEHLSVWEELPEGSVIFCDEVQTYLGTDISQSKPPEWVKEFAKHRHTGKDFIFTTQSPMFLHSFVRKLIKPHVHYTRPWNMAWHQYTWDNVQGDPNSAGSKKIGMRKSVKPDPGVFELYTSTVLDTHKPRPPWKMIGGAAAALVVLLAAGYFAVRWLSPEHAHERAEAALAKQGIVRGSAATGDPVTGLQPKLVNDLGRGPIWTQESMQPRVPGLAYTAPVYDALTAPTDFPRTAACVSSHDPDRCDCYTQQGTPLDVPLSACLVYVRHGSFDPWLTGRRQAQQNQVAQQSPAPAQVMKAQDISAMSPEQPVPAESAQVVASAAQPARQNLISIGSPRAAAGARK